MHAHTYMRSLAFTHNYVIVYNYISIYIMGEREGHFGLAERC